MEAKVYQYSQENKGVLRRLAQTQHDRKGEASCLGTAKVLLVDGGKQRRRRHRGYHAPGLQGFNVDCSGRSGKIIKGENKAGEYLVYPRVLRPATKLLCMYQMERGGCIVDCKIENTRIRGNYARPIED